MTEKQQIEDDLVSKAIQRFYFGSGSFKLKLSSTSVILYNNKSVEIASYVTSGKPLLDIFALGFFPSYEIDIKPENSILTYLGVCAIYHISVATLDFKQSELLSMITDLYDDLPFEVTGVERDHSGSTQPDGSMGIVSLGLN